MESFMMSKVYRMLYMKATKKNRNQPVRRFSKIFVMHPNPALDKPMNNTATEANTQEGTTMWSEINEFWVLSNHVRVGQN